MTDLVSRTAAESLTGPLITISPRRAAAWAATLAAESMLGVCALSVWLSTDANAGPSAHGAVRSPVERFTLQTVVLMRLVLMVIGSLGLLSSFTAVVARLPSTTRMRSCS
jgi:hypothetical protein